MALATYADLLTAIASWLARDDLTGNIPDFVTLFEAEANTRLRVRQQETTTTITPSGGTATLPTDYLSFRRLTWTGSPQRELEYVNSSWPQFNYPTGASGDPNVFTIEGSSLKVDPVSDTGLQLVYFQRIPALSVGANWLYTGFPNAYLHGSLGEAYMFNKKYDAAGAWFARRDSVFDAITTLSNKSRGIGGIRVMGPTP